MITTETKLNLGSRDRAIPEFTGIDCDPHPGVDIVGDISDLSRFASGEVSEIYASHVLEHFPHVKTLNVLKEWARVLKPGGILYVAVPDFARVVDLYAIARAEHVGITDWMENFLWGDQGYSTAFHYAGFDFPRLKKLLLAAGFREASQVQYFPIGHKEDCSNIKSSYDGKSVSLNVLAVR